MNSKQILLALIVPITWGLGFTLAKIGMEQFSALLIMSIRFGIAGLVLVWFTKPPWGHMREIFIVALIGSTIQYGLTYNGLKGIDASTAAILVQLEGPILALMGTILLKEKRLSITLKISQLKKVSEAINQTEIKSIQGGNQTFQKVDEQS